MRAGRLLATRTSCGRASSFVEAAAAGGGVSQRRAALRRQQSVEDTTSPKFLPFARSRPPVRHADVVSAERTPARRPHTPRDVTTGALLVTCTTLAYVSALLEKCETRTRRSLCRQKPLCTAPRRDLTARWGGCQWQVSLLAGAIAAVRRVGKASLLAHLHATRAAGRQRTARRLGSTARTGERPTPRSARATVCAKAYDARACIGKPPSARATVPTAAAQDALLCLALLTWHPPRYGAQTLTVPTTAHARGPETCAPGGAVATSRSALNAPPNEVRARASSR